MSDDGDSWLSSDLVDAGSSTVGAAVGAGLGLAGGPAGVVAGAAVGSALSVALRRVGTELHRRLLGPRQEMRLGMAVDFAVAETQARLERGERLRRDGFFESTDEGGRSAADEIIEGVLISAESDYEERKLKLYGRLLAGLAFREDVARAHANFLVRTVREVSYRHLCLLALSDRRPIPIVEFNGIAHEDARASETLDLAERRLVKETGSGNRLVVPWSNGQLLIELLGLGDLDDEEISSVVAINMGRSATN